MMTTASAIRGFVERVEFGSNFLVIKGWVANKDLTRAEEPVTLRIAGFGDWSIARLFFRPDLQRAGVADGWGAFHETIWLTGPGGQPEIQAKTSGDFTVVSTQATTYEPFSAKGAFDKQVDDEISGWVFDPELAKTKIRPQLLLDGKPVLELELDQLREDQTYNRASDQHFGFRASIRTIRQVVAAAGHDHATLSLVAAGRELDQLQLEALPFAGDTLKLKVDYCSAFGSGILLRGWVCNLDLTPLDMPMFLGLGGTIVEVGSLYSRGDLKRHGIAGGMAGFSAFFDGEGLDPSTLELHCVSAAGTGVTSLPKPEAAAKSVERSIAQVADEVMITLFDPDERTAEIGIWMDDTDIEPLRLEAQATEKKVWTKDGVMPTVAAVKLGWLAGRYREVKGKTGEKPPAERKVSLVADGTRVLVESQVVMAGGYKGRLDRYEEGGVRGWMTTSDGLRMAEYELLINDVVFRKGVANVPRGDLIEKGIARRGGGFLVPIVNPTSEATIEVNVRPAGEDAPLVGGPLMISNADHSQSRLENAYAVYSMAVGVGVSVIVPIYNAAEDVRKCLASLILHTPDSVQIILIDDCSPDPAIQQILAPHVGRANWRVLKNETNLGFTKTVNRGIAEAGNDDVIFLNSDTMVTPGWIQGLRVAAYSAARIATATPLANSAGVFSVPEMNKENALPDGCSLDEYSRIIRQTSLATFPRVPTGNGFCLYVRRDCLNDIGPLDEIAFPVGYGEENDFCMRALHRGYEHVMDDRTLIYHKRSASFGAKKSVHYDTGQETLRRRYPEYSSLTSVFAEAPDILAVRWRIRAALDAGALKALPRVLFVISTTTGGTPQTNADLMAALSDRYEGWVLQCDSKTIRLYRERVSEETLVWQSRLVAAIDPRVHRSQAYNAAVFEILVKFGFELVHIRHIAWHGLDLPQICKILEIPVVFSFHDFYAVCPTIKLLDENGIFCGGKCTSTEGDCSVELWRQSQFPKVKDSFVHRWRDMFSHALSHCDSFVTTSHFAKSLIIDNFADLGKAEFQVIPHGRNFEGFHAMAENGSSDLPMKILVPGNISKAKGAALITELSARDQGKTFEFHILGDHGRLVAGPGLIIHGTYSRDAFAEAARDIGASIGVVFSRWPETYCHTLTELWSIGLPVIGFDIGAVGERIKAHGGGWLLDLEQSDDEILGFLSGLAGDIDERKAQIAQVLAWQNGYGRTYDEAAMAAQYDSIYRELLTRSAGKAELAIPAE